MSHRLLMMISGPAGQDTDTDFVPVKGWMKNRSGLAAAWLLDADTFQTRANNFLDHSNIGESKKSSSP